MDKRKKLRINNLNYERLGRTKGNLSITEKANDILNLYFIARGGLKELKGINKNLNKYKKLIWPVNITATNTYYARNLVPLVGIVNVVLKVDVNLILNLKLYNMNKTDFLDELERICVQALIPTAKKIKEKIKYEESEEQLARNLIGKIGTRIMFSGQFNNKEDLDNIFLR